MKICIKHPELNGLRYGKVGRSGRCVGCAKESNKKWANKNPDNIKCMNSGKAKRRRINERKQVYDHYGRVCVVCGFDHPDALSIDHIDQKGANHLGSDGKRLSGFKLRRWLVVNGFPSGFRTLCMNCQAIEFAKYRHIGGKSND